ncbi:MULTISPECIES: hypothetical protein [Rhizobium]|uniref:hypothetical protein n=1 Tax=Rhizobium TaxID=379 RepID=UPI0013566AB6|nr:hypothetical protein [Rhizobium miluonense]
MIDQPSENSAVRMAEGGLKVRRADVTFLYTIAAAIPQSLIEEKPVFPDQSLQPAF